MSNKTFVSRSIYIPKELNEQLKKLALNEKRSFNQTVNFLLDKLLSDKQLSFPQGDKKHGDATK